MKRLINRFKYYFTTDLMELELTIFDIFIIALSITWALVFSFCIPCALITSFFK